MLYKRPPENEGFSLFWFYFVFSGEPTEVADPSGLLG
jgi:hypothetical protein